ncbi:MAG: adenylate/guanylate cyclase domain-containing protein [Spirochaetes bacterium]|nr:adenylate/guanylate cyclase domain-containing protein [Spirochaetota bacterium]
MFDLTLIKDLTEMIGKSLRFPDIETVGGYFFKGFNLHQLEGIPDSLTISPLTAAKRLVIECENKNKIKNFFIFIIELDGTRLNGRIVKLTGLENLLYRLSRTGIYFDFNKRKLIAFDQDKKLLINWGALKDGKEYPIVIASIDICANSELVKKYKPSIMEKVYYQLWEYLKNKNRIYNGRIWSWAGDGGILAFRGEDGTSCAVNCCLEILLSLPVFNSSPNTPIQDEIKLRIGMDVGNVKFFNNTGRIVSDVINYAAHLEKKGTHPNGLSVSEEVFNELNLSIKKMFRKKIKFEGRIAYSLCYDYNKALS